MQPGGFDLNAILQSAQQMQSSFERELASTTVTGSAGGGLVTVAVNGAGELLGVTIDPSVVDPQDVETLADLVVAAVRDGMHAASELSKQQVGSFAGGLFGSLGQPGLPGLSGLPGLGFAVDDEDEDDLADDDTELDEDDEFDDDLDDEDDPAARDEFEAED